MGSDLAGGESRRSTVRRGCTVCIIYNPYIPPVTRPPHVAVRSSWYILLSPLLALFRRFISLSSIVSASPAPAPRRVSRRSTSPLALRRSPLRYFHALAARHISPAASPTGGTSQQTFHHHPLFPPCCTFHLATSRSTCPARSLGVPELSSTAVAYGNFLDKGSCELIRDEACAGVRGGLDGRSSKRDNCSFSFLIASGGQLAYQR